ncbi:probable BOI-related E3 ubiquitin-protein ligase 3 [Salvia splendens]|uniref:probable BOI-related E3 ubiquitin-protein ligase 3 n=1 Tax=Salvia splendens TaxID=180675 RepID=UPI001C266D69|nr:probable BOI-related E3 ubiquitin-protein ligase 3 [Salvia splendens]
MAIQAHLFPDNLCFPLLNSQDFSAVNGRGFDHPCFAPQQLIQFDQFPNSTNALFHQSTTIERQRFQFEQFLNSQNERLRAAMQEQRKHQMAILMKKCEPLLQQKDEEIAKAADRAVELRTFMKRIEIENLTWRRAAEESEAMIASLSRRLRENGAGDAESCCRNVELIEEENEKTVCRCCNSRNSCVVMLPCRHLCSCRECEVFLDSCPVCSVVKKGAIEALV